MTENQPVGRPSKFTAETCGIVLEALVKGIGRHHAAEMAGISRVTLQAWLAKGRKDKVGGEFSDFLNKVKKAEAQAVEKYVDCIVAAAPQTWQAAAWMLERRWPEDWGNQRAEIAKMKRDIVEIVKYQSRNPPQRGG